MRLLYLELYLEMSRDDHTIDSKNSPIYWFLNNKKTLGVEGTIYTMIQRLLEKLISKSMTTIYNKNKEKIIISVDKLSKICWKNTLKNSFKILSLDLSI